MARLERVQAANGVVTYRSSLLAGAGFLHGFSTRDGGVSGPPFDSMNLGIAQAPGEPDGDGNVAANAALLMEAIGASGAAMVRVRQVHGCAVHHCDGSEAFGPPAVEADALVSADPRAAPCIRTADCVPVLLACPVTGAAAAVHAGWRGIVAGVVGRAVAALEARHGVPRASLLAAVGPSIGCAAYEVGPEVAAAFAAAAGSGFVHPSPVPGGREHIDCHGAVHAQLVASGVPAARIDGEPLCTAGPSREFFSYRRDGARSGRMAAVIVPRALSGPRSASPAQPALPRHCVR